MRKILANRSLWRAAGGWPGNARQALLAGSGFTVLTLGPWLAGMCGCTMFELGSALLVIAAALLGGNSVYGAITGEREKKTLDSLRLTQLTPGQVVFGKLIGEFSALGRLLAVAAPALLVLATLGGAGLETFFMVYGIAALAGLFASVSGIFVSSLAATTSQAVVTGWIVKGVWLVGTPILDVVARAVLVQRDPVPMFTSLNPLAALAVATVPEAADGAFRWIVGLYGVTTVLAVAAMGWMAARRVAQDPSGGLGIEDGRVHDAYRRGWGPKWLQTLVPGLSRNASFLREVAFQTRTGGASWPGYLVYLVLFLAPFLYARAWAVQNEAALNTIVVPPAHVEITAQPPSDLDLPTTSQNPLAPVAYARVPGALTTLVFHGHKPETCFRLGLYQALGVPMPQGSVEVVVVSEPATATYTPDGVVVDRVVQVQSVDATSSDVLQPFGMAPVTPEEAPALSLDRREAAMQRALHVGLTGTLVLFLLYLSIRCTGFLAGALTGEKDRRSWQDLALTGVPAAQVLRGKLWGALVFTLLQMTVVFPVLSLYVFSGSLTGVELLGLYGYAAGLAVVAGLLGLWSSARSRTTHQSQGRALGLSLAAFMIVPLTGTAMVPVLIGGATIAAMVALSRRSGTWAGWLAMAVGLVLAPHAVSPLTAVVSFMPSLYSGTASLLAALDVAPASAGLGLVSFLGTMLFLLGAGQAFWKGALEYVVDREEGSALHAEHKARCA